MPSPDIEEVHSRGDSGKSVLLKNKTKAEGKRIKTMVSRGGRGKEREWEGERGREGEGEDTSQYKLTYTNSYKTQEAESGGLPV